MPSMLDPNPFQPVPREPVHGGNSVIASLPSLVTLLIVALMSFAAGFVISESTDRWMTTQELQAINNSHSLALQQLLDTNAELSDRLRATQQYSQVPTHTVSNP